MRNGWSCGQVHSKICMRHERTKLQRNYLTFLNKAQYVVKHACCIFG